MKIQIPEWLDNFIYEELNGDYERFDVDINLYNTEEINKKYIGTYFPRSWAESKIIFSELFNSSEITKALLSKNKIQILDIGTGTGGNILGLLETLKIQNLLSKEITILTIEGNADAIRLQKLFVNKFNEINNSSIKLITKKVTLTESSLTKIFNELNSKNIKFEIISSFKFISEFYNNEDTYETEKEIKYYKLITELSEKVLSKKGIYLLLDLCSRNFGSPKFRPYTPEIMSKELKDYFLNTPKLSYIFPLSCAFWSEKCNVNECYTEIQFKIKHSKHSNDTSKVTYKVFAFNDFADDIIKKIPKYRKMQISQNSWYPKICNEGTIIKTQDAYKYPNAFKITENE